MSLSITLIIVIITAIISFMAFSNQEMLNKLIFYPPAISKEREWYRFFSNGLIHADLGHLAFNMFSLYLVGKGVKGISVEGKFREIFSDTGPLLYSLLYISALAVCLLPTYSKHKNNSHYRSLGASGAVSAVVFVGILLYPTAKIGLFIIPPVIPAFIFAPIYLVITAYLDKKGDSGINHSAHLWGAIYGIAFLIVTSYFLSDYRPLANFIEEVKNYF